MTTILFLKWKVQMKNKFKKAKFFCENCGEEVPQNAKVCTKCGKFFTFVRCPKCFYTGESKIFTHGCPECGYAIKHNGNYRKPPVLKKSRSSFKELGLIKDKPQKNKRINLSFEDTSLPIWIYVVTLIPLFSVIFGLYSCLNK